MDKKTKLPGKDDVRASLHDQRTELVKGMMAQESAANDAKTARLRALRLAQEAADKDNAPVAEMPKPKRKR